MGAAKMKHQADADHILVERAGKPIVLTHEIELNAFFFSDLCSDARVVSRSAPGPYARVVKLLPPHERRIFFLANTDRTFQADAIPISLGVCRSAG